MEFALFYRTISFVCVLLLVRMVVIELLLHVMKNVKFFQLCNLLRDPVIVYVLAKCDICRHWSALLQ
jgi:hypothetical protein